MLFKANLYLLLDYITCLKFVEIGPFCRILRLSSLRPCCLRFTDLQTCCSRQGAAFATTCGTNLSGSITPIITSCKPGEEFFDSHQVNHSFQIGGGTQGGAAGHPNLLIFGGMVPCPHSSSCLWYNKKAIRRTFKTLISQQGRRTITNRVCIVSHECLLMSSSCT